MQTGATDRAIRSAYHVLVKVWHPDRLQQDPALRAQAEEKLKQVTAAYRYLTSKHADEEPPPAESARQAATPPSSKASGEAEVDSKQQRAQPIGPAWVSILRTIIFSSLGVACIYILGFALAGWLLFKPIDRFLRSEPLTASSYLELRNDIHRGLWGAGTAVSG